MKLLWTWVTTKDAHYCEIEQRRINTVNEKPDTIIECCRMAYYEVGNYVMCVHYLCNTEKYNEQGVRLRAHTLFFGRVQGAISIKSKVRKKSLFLSPRYLIMRPY